MSGPKLALHFFRFALAVMVWTSLAPSAVRAVSALTEDPVLRAMVICSSSASAPDPSGSPGEAMGDCPLCTLQAHGMGPAPQTPAPLLLQHLGQAVPTLFLQAPRLLFAWAPAQSRAPPLRA